MRRLGRPNTTPTSAETSPLTMIQTRIFTSGKDRLELVAGIGADAHECAGPERQEARISGQQVEPDGAQRQDEEWDHHAVDEELIAERRDHDEGDEEDERHSVAVLADREDRHVGRIGRLVLTGFAIEHGQSPADPLAPLAGRGLGFEGAMQPGPPPRPAAPGLFVADSPSEDGRPSGRPMAPPSPRERGEESLQIRSMILSPNRPCGRTRRNARAMT